MKSDNATMGTYAYAIFLFGVSSIGMMMANKYAITALPLPASLVTLQSASTIVLLQCVGCGLVDGLRTDRVRKWLPIASLFAWMLYSSLKAFEHSTVSTILIFRNAGSIVTTAVEFIVRGERVTMEVVAAEAVIVVGSVMYGLGSVTFSWLGLAWIFANVVGQVTYGVLVKYTMDREACIRSMSKYSMSFYNNLLALPMMIMTTVLLGEHHNNFVEVTRLLIEEWMWVIFTCILGFMISTSGFGLQQLVSATTFLVVNNAAKFVNIALGILVLHDRIAGWVDGVGCLIALSGGVWYSIAQRRSIERGRHENSQA